MAVRAAPKPRAKKLPAPITATVTADLHGQRLDKVLAFLLGGTDAALSRARIQALIEEGHVTFGGKPITQVSRKTKENEVYSVQIPLPEMAEPAAQKIPLTIVFEDKDLLVIDKAIGMVVHPAPGNRDRTLVNALLAHCGKTLSGIGGVARPGIVHRLDKDTGGLMVVAKNDASHQALSKQFSDRTLSRTYSALVWGTPSPLAGSIEGSIGRSERDRKKMAVSNKGKVALTHYRVLETFDVASFVECKLATGRTHQIRVHFSHFKHPLVGDQVYGRKKQPTDKKHPYLAEFPRQALHAAEITFVHPRTGKPVHFKSALPKDFQKLLRQLRSGK
jgi:23S rRNA pseudouridine1911/1915/1917 synthase